MYLTLAYLILILPYVTLKLERHITQGVVKLPYVTLKLERHITQGVFKLQTLCHLYLTQRWYIARGWLSKDDRPRTGSSSATSLRKTILRIFRVV